MAGYTPPNSTGIPFTFTKDGYTSPSKPLTFNFRPEYYTSNLKAAIQVMGIYQESTYTYKKSCPTYVVGYSAYGIQILKGPCEYGGIRDLGAFIEVKQKQQGADDLSAFLKPILGRSFRDLGALIKSYEHEDLPSSIVGLYTKNLLSIIDTHSPSDIPGYVRVFQRAFGDLPASMYGWQASDLSTFIRGLTSHDLPSAIEAIPPLDLPAYLKVWPEDYLHASVYGWSFYDLGVYIKGKPYSDLGGSIVAHKWVNLTAYLKGWVTEAYEDLPAYIRSFQYKDLSSYIFSYEIKDLSGLIIPIPYATLQGIIHGWQVSDLGAILNGKDYPYNLTASIVGNGGFRDLAAGIKSLKSAGHVFNLNATVSSWDSRGLSASLIVPQYGNLTAEVFPVGYGNLNASVFPKMIKLTTILGVVTMNSNDLQAMINVSCVSSMHVNLPSSVRIVYKKDLGAYIKGLKYYSSYDLSARSGETLFANVLDKLPISIKIDSDNALVYDRLSIHIDLFRGGHDLSAYIVSEGPTSSLTASITGRSISSFAFMRTKSREKVYKSRDEYDRSMELNKVVEFSFKDAVREYVYLSTANKAFAREFIDKWAMSIKGFSPTNRRLGVKRKLFRAATLYDIKRYTSVDQAIRDMIEFVTWEPAIDLSASINLMYNSMSVNLSAIINSIYTTSTTDSLKATIVGETETKLAVSYESGTVDLVE